MVVMAGGTLALDPQESAVVVRALRNSLTRGWVEYDPTRIPLLIDAVEAAEGVPFGVSLPSRHVLADVLKWACSIHQRPRYSQLELGALHAVRRRL